MNPLLWLLLAILAALAFLVWASASICSGIYLKALCRKPGESRKILLSFDDGPHPEQTPRILDLLKRHHAHASFFLVGHRIAGQEALVERMTLEGHSLGNHGFSHQWYFPLKSGRAIAAEIRACNDEVARVSGSLPRYFRPPFGVSNPRVARGVARSGMKVVGWSIRSLDTRGEDPRKVVRRVCTRLRGGHIVLLHDQSPHVLDILKEILAFAEQEGLQCVNLEKFTDHEAEHGL